MSYTHLHKDLEVGEAIQNLLDRLSQYERSTGREYLFMLLPRDPDGIPVCSFTAPISPVQALQIAPEFPHAGSRETFIPR